MLLHPLDWEAIALNESGQDWRNNLGRVSENDKGVHVGPLNIEKNNWKAFGGGWSLAILVQKKFLVLKIK